MLELKNYTVEIISGVYAEITHTDSGQHVNEFPFNPKTFEADIAASIAEYEIEQDDLEQTDREIGEWRATGTKAA